jgi:hypothetical protein
MRTNCRRRQRRDAPLTREAQPILSDGAPSDIGLSPKAALSIAKRDCGMPNDDAAVAPC